ncbi:MAG: response regulator [Clostridia bacterium]|nr:response regulator [Clostridia bacterium]
MISLMIADDDVQYVELLSKLLTKDEELMIVKKSYNGMDTIMSYTALTPDVLLLDLNMPGMNGIEVIEYLSKLPNEENKKNIIVLSSDHFYQSTIQKYDKVKGMISKDWNIDFLIDLIKDIKETDSQKILVQNSIDSLMEKLHFDECLKGTKILRDAIFLSFYNISYTKDIPKLLDELSKKYPNITPSTIRSLMDKSINNMYEFNYKKPNFLSKIFSDYCGFKPTTKSFITYAVKHLHNVVKNQKN